MSRQRKPKAGPASMWDQAEEVPRAGIPSTEALAKRQRWGRRVIWVCVFSFPVMAVSMLVMASSLKVAGNVQPVVEQVNTQARATAMAAVSDWLAGTPSPLPGGVLVSWDEAQVLPGYVPKSTDTGTNPAATAVMESHSLTVRDGSGATYTAQVLVATNDKGEVSVIGTPSLTPVAPSSNWAAALSPWPNAQQASPSAPVATAVEAWVNAFTSGDPAMLRQVVGDPATDHAYAALSGLVSAKHQVSGSAWVVGSDRKATSQMLVQVKVQFTWPRSDVAKGGPKEATYDLLVEGAASAAPRVVAWGGAGTGPVLKAYGNAVVGRDLKEQAPSTTVTGATTTTPPPQVAATAGAGTQTEQAPTETTTTTQQGTKG